MIGMEQVQEPLEEIEFSPHAAMNRRPPTSKAKQLEADLWSARLGFPSDWQLDVLPLNAAGLPTKFCPHPFSHYEWKTSARMHRNPRGKDPERVIERGMRFYLDYGFMRASATDYSRPSKATDRVVQSFDGYNCYLLIVDEVSHHVWVFLCQSKEPPVEIVGLPACLQS